MTEEKNMERRKAARLDIPIKVQYRVVGKEERAIEAESRNLSAGGCLLLVHEELPADSEVELDIFLGDNDSEMLKLRGRLKRMSGREGNNFEYGIVFDDLGLATRRLFADFCFAKMYEMVGLKEPDK